MISVVLRGNLGNQMWQYAVCRTVAEKNGYDFHIPRNFSGRFFGCNLGVSADETNKIHAEEGHFSFQRFDENLFSIGDFTRLDGFFQSEKYILNNRKNILKWFPVPDIPDLLERVGVDENTCILNVRGREYKKLKDVFLNKKYWEDSMAKMLEINSHVNFIVVTDDPELCFSWFPGLPIYNYGVLEDLTLVHKAPYLIIANSSFSWWGAWLNEKAKRIIAPKYWFRHNVSNGFWSPADAITGRFHYMDRAGRLQTSQECQSEITEKNYADLAAYLRKNVKTPLRRQFNWLRKIGGLAFVRNLMDRRRY